MSSYSSLDTHVVGLTTPVHRSPSSLALNSGHHAAPSFSSSEETPMISVVGVQGSPRFGGTPSPSQDQDEPLLDKYGGKSTSAVAAALGEASLASCTAAMANTILGAGMLGLPHAMAESGFALGTILLVLAGCASAFALHLLAVSAKTVGVFPSSFYVVATKAVPRAAWLIDLAVAIKCFGVGTSFLIVIGDLMPEASMTFFGANAHGLVTQRRFWILIFMAVVIPLSCLRSLNALRFTATLSVFFVCFLTGVITLYALVPDLHECAGIDPDICKGPRENFQLNRGTLKILSIFVFGFTCHQNIFTVSNELKDFTIPRINIVIQGCISVAFVLYVLISTMAYHTYGSAIQSNVLKNYPDNYVFAIARLALSLNVAFSYPLQCNPCRNSVSLLMHQWEHRATVGEIAVHLPSKTRIAILTGLIVSASLGIAMIVSDLGVILSIVGATGSTMISYILPGLIFLKVHPVWTPKHYLAATLLGMGCLIIPSCLTFIFI